MYTRTCTHTVARLTCLILWFTQHFSTRRIFLCKEKDGGQISFRYYLFLLQSTNVNGWKFCTYSNFFLAPVTQSLRSDSLIFLKKLFYLLQWKPFKNDERCFLFHLKSSILSQDIYIFVLTFCSYTKTCLIRKIRLISKSTS